MKSAEEYLIKKFTEIGSSPDYVKDMVLNDPEFKAVIKAIESHTKEHLTFLKDQLEKELEECIVPTYCNGIRYSLTLISDLIKADSK